MLLALAAAVDRTSGAYTVGRIIGYVVIALVIVLVIRAVTNKNRDR